MKIIIITIFRYLDTITIGQDSSLFNTKLVDIMDDFDLVPNNTLTVKKLKEEKSLILVTPKKGKKKD